MKRVSFSRNVVYLKYCWRINYKFYLMRTMVAFNLRNVSLYFALYDLSSGKVCWILIISVHGLVSIIPLSRGYRENSAAGWSTVEPQKTANALSTMDLSPANLFLLQWIRAMLTSITSRANDACVVCNFFLFYKI